MEIRPQALELVSGFLAPIPFPIGEMGHRKRDLPPTSEGDGFRELTHIPYSRHFKVVSLSPPLQPSVCPSPSTPFSVLPPFPQTPLTMPVMTGTCDPSRLWLHITLAL